MESTFWSIIPPIVAIILAIRTKQVIFSLLVGLFIGFGILNNGNIFSGFLDMISQFVKVFQSESNTRIILLTFCIGALIQLIRYTRGIQGFIKWIQQSGQKNIKKRIQVLAALSGFLIFIESNISILTVGTVFRPLFDKFGISREKLAYIIDSSSAPSCILFPINTWGAFVMGLLVLSDPDINPFEVLLFSIPFNFYAILTLAFVFWVTITGRDYGYMKKSYKNINKQIDKIEVTSKEDKGASAWNMILPIATMTISMPIFLIISGWESLSNETISGHLWHALTKGSGSQAVLFACCLALFLSSIIFLIQKKMTIFSLISESMKGMQEMIVMAILMVLAFALGDLCKLLGTGDYMAQIAGSYLIPEVTPAVLFILSSIIAFSTGTSWGTYAIMIAIAVPLSTAIGANFYLCIAAVLGGGVFGDHCSPISDTTLISSIAAECDHVEHVKTQLPYALTTGGIALILYLIAGYLI